MKVWGQPVQVRDVCVLVVLVSIYQEKIHAKSGPKVQRRHKWTMLKLFIIDTWISKDLFFRNTWLNVSKWRSIHSSKKQAIIKKNQFLCYHNSRGDGIGFLHWQIIFFLTRTSLYKRNYFFTEIYDRKCRHVLSFLSHSEHIAQVNIWVLSCRSQCKIPADF